ncbi:MAG: hypothetical protein ACLTGI_03355 [Hoylesella buccalis]
MSCASSAIYSYFGVDLGDLGVVGSVFLGAIGSFFCGTVGSVLLGLMGLTSCG